MLLITTYKAVGSRSPEAAKALMKRFGEVGATPGEVAHYVFADGSGGVVIAEADDAKVLHEAALAYSEWLEFDTQIVLNLDDALPGILASLDR